jgi:hypothetical protein
MESSRGRVAEKSREEREESCWSVRPALHFFAPMGMCTTMHFHSALTNIPQILVNEMSLTPFNRHNCQAMLNTLYPPVMTVQPTAKLTISTLMTQREGFFKYIQTVEKRGVKCLETLINQGRKDNEPNGWMSVKRHLNEYLRLANSVITECWDVNNISLDEAVTRAEAARQQAIETERRNGRKVDSGFSFGFDGKHSKSPSTSSSHRSTFSEPKRPATPIGRGGSTLERIARELRKIRPKHMEVTEMIPQRSYEDIQKENSPHPPAPSKSKGVSRLRKMKSLGALGDLKHNNSSASGTISASGSQEKSFQDAYNTDEMKRAREAFQRRAQGA